MESEKAPKQSDGKREISGPGLAWELLPLHMWDNILARLPISSLFRTKSVCKTWRNIIQSESFRSSYRLVNHQESYFVLFADFNNQKVAAAYNPTENKWVLISLSFVSSSCPSTCCRLRRALVSHEGLVLAEDEKGSIVVLNLFTQTHRVLPPMLPMIWTRVLAIISEGNTSYKIVAVSSAVWDRIGSQVYDSRTNRWEAKDEVEVKYANFESAVYLDGLLYCLNIREKLFAFDLEKGSWHFVDVKMPPLISSRLLVYHGDLLLVGGHVEFGVKWGIGIWELDRLAKKWKRICSMPDHLFCKFGRGVIYEFLTVDCHGKICFNTNTSTDVLMYDLLENNWGWLPRCPLENSQNKLSWFGHGVEPRIDELV
ncbi:F-box/kelch-repeat protein At5g15710-like [Telopea speciosissima]|uniref:F-box/kelch-repeat protein At5g15710-like n=1 Tax=Telopea speciosissima TaxID=54955 RepID=UPI001CC6E950|nr:F-box/kelch-repeat protein At5g15710-like [Telopea speciosissima]